MQIHYGVNMKTLKPFNVTYSFKLRKGGRIYTRELYVNAPDAQDAKRQVVHAENRGCYRFRIDSVTPHQHK